MADIFDEFRKIFNANFRSTNNINKDQEPEEDRILDLDNDIPDINNIFDLGPEKVSQDNNFKSYRISYRFGTGMDKPEIKVNDETIDPEMLAKMQKAMGMPEDFMKELGMQMPFNLPNFNMMQPQSSQPVQLQIESDNKEPFYEIHDEDTHLTIIIELPGVEKQDVSLQASSDEVDINGFNIRLPKKIETESAKSRMKNGILEVRFNKAPCQEKKVIPID